MRTICVLAAVAVMQTAGLARNAGRHVGDPFRAWMIGEGRWYNDALAALAWGSVAVACVAYLRYRLRLSRDGATAPLRPWRQRREMRFVLFVCVGTLFAQLPLMVYETIAALNDPTPPTGNVAEAFVVDGVLPPLAGLAILAYDRWRGNREERMSGNLCLACGYDLRATPERCPECGAVPREKSGR